MAGVSTKTPGPKCLFYLIFRNILRKIKCFTPGGPIIGTRGG